jgi:hypothetical protein
MQIKPSEFWGTDYYKNPKLTDAMVAEAQRILGVTLPEAFIALLRVQNGGYTRCFVFPTSRRTTWAEDHVPLDELYGIDPKDDLTRSHNILHTAYMTEEWGLPPKQVLLAGDGHWWITLDYRKGSIPSVAWIDVEVGQDVQLAPSFEEFMAGLLPKDAVDGKTGKLKKKR